MTGTAKVNLEPCPFCHESPRRENIGCAPRDRHVVPEWRYWIYCGNCGARGPVEHSESGALDAWNTHSSRTCAHTGANDG